MCSYSRCSLVFGDGYIEMQKHALLFLPSLLGILGGTILSHGGSNLHRAVLMGT